MISDNLVTAHAHNVIILYGATVNINPVSAPDLATGIVPILLRENRAYDNSFKVASPQFQNYCSYNGV